MKVKELIKLLKSCDPDEAIAVAFYTGGYVEEYVKTYHESNINKKDVANIIEIFNEEMNSTALNCQLMDVINNYLEEHENE